MIDKKYLEGEVKRRINFEDLLFDKILNEKYIIEVTE